MLTYLEIKEGCEFSPYGTGRYVLHTPDHRHFLVSDTTKELLEALSLRTPLEAICESLSGSSESGTSAAQLKSMIEKRYDHLGILSPSHIPTTQTVSKPNAPGLGFLQCWDLLPDVLVKRAATRLSWLYGKPPLLIMLALIVASHISLYSHIFGAFHFRLPHGSPLAILLLSLLSILAHEMGHASALSRFGAGPGKIGFGLYLLMPAFFADVSEIWRLPRRARLAVDLGGVYFQQAVFVVFAILAARYASLEFAAPCYAIDTMTLFALNPVFRFDGYWLLADWLERPTLRRDAIRLQKQWGSRTLAWLHSQTLPIRDGHQQATGARVAVFTIYTVFCNLFWLFSVLLSLRYLRVGLFAFFQKLPMMVSQIRLAAAARDWAGVTDEIVLVLVASAFSATAIFGLYFYARLLFSLLRRSLPLRHAATNLNSKGRNL